MSKAKKRKIKFILLEDVKTEFEKYGKIITESIVFEGSEQNENGESKQEKNTAKFLFSDHSKVAKNLIRPYNQFRSNGQNVSKPAPEELYLSKKFKGSLTNVIIFLDINWTNQDKNEYGLNYAVDCLIKDHIPARNIIVLTNYSVNEKNFNGFSHHLKGTQFEEDKIWNLITQTDAYQNPVTPLKENEHFPSHR